jgi:hypothetical protein
VERYYACYREKDGVDVFEELEPTEADVRFEAVAAIASENLRILRSRGAVTWREEAENVAAVYAADPKRFAEWRADEGYSQPTGSRMLSVCAFLERDELRDRPADVQIEAARAIRDEKAPRADIIADAGVLSVTDFRARYWPAKGAPDKERCPTCGLLVDPKRLHPEEES